MIMFFFLLILDLSFMIKILLFVVAHNYFSANTYTLPGK